MEGYRLAAQQVELQLAMLGLNVETGAAASRHFKPAGSNLIEFTEEGFAALQNYYSGKGKSLSIIEGNENYLKGSEESATGVVATYYRKVSRITKSKTISTAEKKYEAAQQKVISTRRALEEALEGKHESGPQLSGFSSNKVKALFNHLVALVDAGLYKIESGIEGLKEKLAEAKLEIPREEVMQEAMSVYVEWMNKTRINAKYLEQYKDAALGERVDKITENSISPMMKEVYVLIDEPDKIIAIIKDKSFIPRLNKELEYLRELEINEVEVLEIIGRTTHYGREAIIMKRYSKSSKSILDIVQKKLKLVGPHEANSLNINSLRSLQKIQAKLFEKGIAISDIQFLIAEDGTFVVNDPLGILHKNQAGHKGLENKNKEILEKFIELSVDNIVRGKLKTNPKIVWNKNQLLESLNNVMEADILLEEAIKRLIDRGALEDLGNGQFKLKKAI